MGERRSSRGVAMETAATEKLLQTLDEPDEPDAAQEAHGLQGRRLGINGVGFRLGAIHLKPFIAIRCHVEAAVGQLEEVPVAAIVVLRLITGDVKDVGFDLQGKGVAEQIGGE